MSTPATVNFSFFQHLSEEEQIQAKAFDKRKSELTTAWNQLFEDFKITNAQQLISCGISEEGRFQTMVHYSNWSVARK